MDDSRYARLEEDDVSQILDQIDGWYSRYKGSLSGIDSDIRKWLVNPKSKADKLKVLLKTHKQGLDIKNMFPSIFKDLAFPAIRNRLSEKGYSKKEIEAVMEALKIVRDGTRVG